MTGPSNLVHQQGHGAHGEVHFRHYSVLPQNPPGSSSLLALGNMGALNINSGHTMWIHQQNVWSIVLNLPEFPVLPPCTFTTALSFHTIYPFCTAIQNDPSYNCKVHTVIPITNHMSNVCPRVCAEYLSPYKSIGSHINNVTYTTPSNGASQYTWTLLFPSRHFSHCDRVQSRDSNLGK